MARKPVKIQRKVQQDALGKVNRVKEIRRRGKDDLKITDNKHYVREKEYAPDVSSYSHVRKVGFVPLNNILALLPKNMTKILFLS